MIGVGRAVVGREAWDRLVAQSRCSTFWHRWDWCEYQVAYGGQVDVSVAVVIDEHVVGVAPAWRLGSMLQMSGDPCPLPAISDGVSASDVLIEMSRYWSTTGSETALFRSPPSRAPLVGAGHKTRIISMQAPLDKLWSRVRRSYQSLIHQAQRKFKILVGSGAQASRLMDDYCELSKKTSERIHGTYAFQQEWVEQGSAWVAVAYAETWPVAAALVLRHHGMAYYASGPSTVRNAQHALQWALIEEMVADDRVEWYETGWQGHAKDQKGRNIEFFKRGFGGEDWNIAVRHISIPEISGIYPHSEDLDSRGITHTE